MAQFVDEIDKLIEYVKQRTREAIAEGYVTDDVVDVFEKEIRGLDPNILLFIEGYLEEITK